MNVDPENIPLSPKAAAPDPQRWLAEVGERLSPEDAALVARAAAFALPTYGQARLPSGEPVADHAVATAAILAGMRPDAEGIAAALLAAGPGLLGGGTAALKDRFPEAVVTLVEGVERMGQIQALAGGSIPGREQGAQVEQLRKMLLAMVEDIRVVLIKLADRIQTLRYLAATDHPSRAEVGRETLDLISPLANRLGVWQAKWELEDLSFRFIEPALYKQVARMLDERRGDRERYIADVLAVLDRELRASGLSGFEVKGRPKHIYSIYKKMRRKHVGIEEIYDARAVRILVKDVKDCYTALGVVHNLWQPIPKEFDDYIARPKGNDYRSLHTAVVGPEDKAVEVQIRTFDMHQHAELGVAAHWRYKEGGRQDAKYQDRIAWLRQILDWKDEMADADDLAGQFRTALFDDTVYVLTPQGRVVDLPKGSTPVDFAYAVHTDLGHRCRGAKVDGAMVPLNHRLQNAQRVEIVAAKQGGPSRDWLNPALGFTGSHRARSKVKQWFKQQELQQTVADGRAVVEKELQRLGLTAMALEKVAEKFNVPKLEDFLASVGRGEVNTRQLAIAIQGDTREAVAEPEPELHVRKATSAGSGGMLVVGGVDRLLTQLARCCKPAPPDRIIGFVTRGRGVAIHRHDCPNVARLGVVHGERLIQADWGTATGAVFPVDVQVIAHDRQGLLRDISDILSREKVNVIAANTVSRGATAYMNFTVEVAGVDQLKRVLGMVREVTGVSRAERR